MSYVLTSILFLSVCLAKPVSAFAFSSCEGEATAVMQAYGGENLQVFHDGVSGSYVNASGYVSYTFTRGDQECYVSYFLKGTYFGALCSDSHYGSPEPASCGKPGTWTRYRRTRAQ